MLIIWFWQAVLFYLDQNYVVNLQTADPAILQINEVVQYKRDSNLRFLSDFITDRKGVVFLAIITEMAILRQITKRSK
jgi:hypothetical protein